MSGAIWDPNKNSRLLYYLRSLAHLALPGALHRRRRERTLARLDRLDPRDAAPILERVAYCNQVCGPFDLPPGAAPLRLGALRNRRNYAFDLFEYSRCFPRGLRISHRFGDETAVPAVPTIVKARPIEGANENSILFKLNKVRHYAFVADRRSFESKRDRLVWRGNAARPHRRRFLEAYFQHELCDIGHIGRSPDPIPWVRPYLSIAEQLQNKFVLSIEGNDVATNLKWILSSNSLCFMRRPRFETWFLEGRLVPDQHYVLLADDHSDLDEKLRYYASHAGEARRIIANAQAHVAPFRDAAGEDLVALLVLRKYFEDSGQLERASVGQQDQPGARAEGRGDLHEAPGGIRGEVQQRVGAGREQRGG